MQDHKEKQAVVKGLRAIEKNGTCELVEQPLEKNCEMQVDLHC